MDAVFRHLTATIPPQDRQRIQTVSNNASLVLDNSIKKRILRHSKWLTEGTGWVPYKKAADLTVACTTGALILIGAGNAGISAMNGGCSPTTRDRKSSIVDLSVGAGCAVAGAIGGAAIWFLKTEGDIDFKEWSLDQDCQNLRNFITVEYGDHPQFEDYQCEIKMTVMTTPLKLPSGHFIDRTTLKEMSKDAFGVYSDPWSRRPFTEETLKVHCESAIKIGKRIRVLMRKDAEKIKDASPILVQTFSQIITLQNKFIDSLYKKAIKELMTEDTTYEEAAQIRTSLEARCEGGPQADPVMTETEVKLGH